MNAIKLIVSAFVLGIITGPAAYAAPACPRAVVFEPAATGSSFDAGWTGIAHDVPVVGYTLRMGLSCGAGSPPCGSCSITGIEPNAGGNNQRCLGDTSIICTTATEVDDCGGPGLCRFFASPATPISTGGVSTCYTNEIAGAVTGTVDVEAGALSPTVPLHLELYLGDVDQDHPCPRCVGDGASNDNVRAGTCDAGPRVGLACDGNASHEYPDFGTTSFDCPPAPLGKIADFVLGTVSFSTGTQSRVVSTANPFCKGTFTGERCMCDTCNNVAAERCATNADCPDPAGPIGAICGGTRCLGGGNNGAACTTNAECPAGACNRPGQPTKPNGCLDDTVTMGPACVDTSPVDGEGECVAGPVTQSCNAASGHPQRPCLDDMDCGGLFDSCRSSNFKCYLDLGVVGGTVSVTGIATPPAGNTSDPTALGALTCVAPAESSSVNSVGGFPGLARYYYPGSATFAEKIVVEVAPPGGIVTTQGSGSPSVVETAVLTPTGGEVQIIGTFTTGTPPAGYTFLGRLVQIEAPAASAANPLGIAFDIDASEIPPGHDETTIAIFRNGVGPIPDCPGATQAIPNDPCITHRAALGGGDVAIGILTSTASDWTMATLDDVDPCPPAIDGTCRAPFVGGKSQLTIVDKSPDSKDQLQWKWLKGSATTFPEFGNPVGADDYALCVYNPNRTATLLMPAGDTCAGKQCWTAKTSTFVYKDKDLTPSGIAQLTLKAGVDSKAQIQVKGKGDNLPMPVVGAPMTVQLRNLTSGACWTATFSPPYAKNDGITFKDKAD